MRTNQQPMSSQQMRLLHFLMGGGRYSVADIMNALYIGDPRSSIRDLRNRGIQVKDEWVPSVNGGKYKRFWIPRGGEQ